MTPYFEIIRLSLKDINVPTQTERRQTGCVMFVEWTPHPIKGVPLPPHRRFVGSCKLPVEHTIAFALDFSSHPWLAKRSDPMEMAQLPPSTIPTIQWLLQQLSGASQAWHTLRYEHDVNAISDSMLTMICWCVHEVKDKWSIGGRTYRQTNVLSSSSNAVSHYLISSSHPNPIPPTAHSYSPNSTLRELLRHWDRDSRSLLRQRQWSRRFSHTILTLGLQESLEPRSPLLFFLRLDSR